jgi:hypothetical protein
MAVDRDRPGNRPEEALEPTTPLPPSTAGLRHEGATLDNGEVVAGRFSIARFIARGGMGAVYEAEDTTLRTRVALKTILPEFAADPNAMERFRREVLLARRITHFNVCRIFELYDAVDARGSGSLTMELLLADACQRARTGPMATPSSRCSSASSPMGWRRCTSGRGARDQAGQRLPGAPPTPPRATPLRQ